MSSEEDNTSKVEEQNKYIESLKQQNNALKSVIQSIIPLLDKLQRSHSTQLGTISTGIEQFLAAIPKVEPSINKKDN